MACFRDGFAISQHVHVLPGHFPVTWIRSLGWVFYFSRDYMHCPTTRGPMPKHILPTDEFTSAATKQDQCNGTTQRTITLTSLVLGWTGWQEVLGQGISVIAKQPLKHYHASSHSRAEAHLGPVGRDTRVCRCHHGGLLSLYSLTGQLCLCYFCPACLAWFTPDISRKLSNGNTKKMRSPTWDNRRHGSVPGAGEC